VRTARGACCRSYTHTVRFGESASGQLDQQRRMVVTPSTTHLMPVIRSTKHPVDGAPLRDAEDR
jgi:hypothetical protein